MDRIKNFVIVLEPHDLKKTPLNYVQSRTFKDISENVEKQMADEGYWYRFVFVRRKEDLAGIALNINNSSFDFYWRETHYLSQLTRDEFFERVRHGFNPSLEGVLGLQAGEEFQTTYAIIKA